MKAMVSWMMNGLVAVLAAAEFGKSGTGGSPLKEGRNMEKIFASVVFVAVLGVFVMGSVQPVSAEVPGTISYQGYLEDSDGNPLDVTVDMVFKIYDADGANGTVQWSETHTDVDVTNGIFSVILGKDENNGIRTDVAEGDRYLGVTVGDDEEMIPRQKLNSVAFAVRAGVAELAESVADGAVVESDPVWTGVSSNYFTKSEMASVATSGSYKDLTDKPTLETVATSGSYKDLTDKPTESDPQVGDNTDNYVPKWNETALVTGSICDKGKVGIGTDNPRATLDVKGIIKATSEPLPADFFDTFGEGLYMRYDDSGEDSGGDIGAIHTGDHPQFERLFLSGDPTLINAGYGAGNVGIGPFVEYDSSGKVSNVKRPRNQLDVAGSVAIGTGYAGKKLAPINGLFVEGFTVIGNFGDSFDDARSASSYAGADNGLLVSGKVAIGYEDPRQLDNNVSSHNAKLFVNGGLRAKKGDTNGDGSNVGYAFERDGDTGMFAVGGTSYDGSDLVFKVNNTPRLTLNNNGRADFSGFHLGTPAESANGWIGMTWLGDNTYWDTNSKTWKRKPGEWNHLGGIVVRGERTYFLSRGSWEDENEWSQEDFFEENTTIFMNGWQVGINTIDPKQALDVHGNIAVYGVYHTSDRRWKKDIDPLRSSLEKVSKLQGVSYKWDVENHPEMEFSEDEQIGFIAQDVEPIIPELVTTDDDGYKSVSYEKMTAVLVEAVKELKAQNDALKAVVCQDHPEEAICQ